MAGEKGKAKKQVSKKPKSSQHPTKEESLSTIKEAMNRIVEGDDPRHHLR
tara:strand:+ start:4289 stop:4438 length:150 start_codon:yes stop_codon:yes gene_type:complete